MNSSAPALELREVSKRFGRTEIIRDVSLQIEHGELVLRPWIPETWDGVRYRISWRGYRLRVTVLGSEPRVLLEGPEGGKLTMTYAGRPVELPVGEETVLSS